MIVKFVLFVLTTAVRRKAPPCNTDIEKLGIELSSSPVYPHYKPAKVISDELITQLAKMGTSDPPIFKQGINEGVTDWVDLST